MKEIFLILAALAGAPEPAPEFRAPNLTRRGTYQAATAAEVNKLLQFDLLWTDDDSPRA